MPKLRIVSIIIAVRFPHRGRAFFAVKDAACTPENEKLVIEILELLIPGKRIGHIDFINKERHGLVVSEKNVTFDLLCKEKDTDEEFLVEVQNREMDSFRDWMLSYSTYPVREQLASMTVTQRQNYDTIMTNELDRICQISFAEKKGKAEGKAEERAENVKALLRAGFDAGTIAKALGLTPEEIEKLA